MVNKLILVLKHIKGHGEIKRKFMYFRTCFKHVSSCLGRDDITAPKWGGLVTWETLFLLWSAAVHQQGWPHLQLKRFDLCPFGLVKQGEKNPSQAEKFKADILQLSWVHPACVKCKCSDFMMSKQLKKEQWEAWESGQILWHVPVILEKNMFFIFQ